MRARRSGERHQTAVKLRRLRRHLAGRRDPGGPTARPSNRHRQYSATSACPSAPTRLRGSLELRADGAARFLGFSGHPCVDCDPHRRILCPAACEMAAGRHDEREPISSAASTSRRGSVYGVQAGRCAPNGHGRVEGFSDRPDDQTCQATACETCCRQALRIKARPSNTALRNAS